MRTSSFSVLLLSLFLALPGLASAETWEEYNRMLTELENKVASAQKTLAALQVRKKMAGSPKEKSEILSEMADVYRRLAQLSRDLELKVDTMKYRFPNRGHDKKERYYRGKIKEVELLAEEKDIEEEIDEIISIVTRQLGPTHFQNQQTQSKHLELKIPGGEEAERAPASKDADSVDRPIIIRK